MTIISISKIAVRILFLLVLIVSIYSNYQEFQRFVFNGIGSIEQSLLFLVSAIALLAHVAGSARRYLLLICASGLMLMLSYEVGSILLGLSGIGGTPYFPSSAQWLFYLIVGSVYVSIIALEASEIRSGEQLSDADVFD